MAAVTNVVAIRTQYRRIGSRGVMSSPLPPGRRGRPGRFRWSRGRGPVGKGHPLWPQVRDALMPHPRLVQGALDDAVARHAPVALAATRGECDVVPRDPHGSKVAPTRTRPLPLVPVAHPYTPSEPLVQGDDLRLPATVAAGGAPSSALPLHGLEAGGPMPPVAPCGDLSDTLRNPLDCGIGPVPLTASQLDAAASAHVPARGLPLVRGDPQAHVSREASADAAHDTPRRLLAAHDEQEVVGRTRDPPSTPLHLPVQLVEPPMGTPG